MICKGLAIAMIAAVAGFSLQAQTPEPRAKAEPRSFSWAFSSDGYLGVETVEVSNENFGKYGLSGVRGVAVEKVVKDSPAEKAGLQAGDVILRVNGEEITGTRKLSRLIGEIAPDHIARVTVFRGGSERDIDITVGKRPLPRFDETGLFGRTEGFRNVPMPPDAPSAESPPRVPGAPGQPGLWVFGSRRQIGIGLTPLTKELAEHFGVEGGVMINSVRADSPAAKAGLKAGDIIIEADGQAIKSDSELIRAIGEKKEGSVTIGFVRGGNRQTVSVTPEEVKGGFDGHFEFRTVPDAPQIPNLLRVMPPAGPMAPASLGNFYFPGRVI